MRGLGQLLLYPYLVAHPYSIDARQLYAVAAILRRPRSVRQDEAVGLQISLLPQKAGSVLALDLGGFWDLGFQGLPSHNRCAARGAFPSLRLEEETLPLLSGVGEEWNA